MLTPCSPSLPKPRIFIYDLPRRVLPRQGNWRLTVDLPRWLASSPFVETSGECADYYLVPSYPHNCVSDRKDQLCGDGNTARAFDYIRTRWPWWNRTARMGVARHVMLLPCDDGPGGCAFDRPIVPNKWSPGTMPQAEQDARNRVALFRDAADAAYLRRTWGDDWEQINPASPSRLLLFLTLNGGADGLLDPRGACRTCFAHGLDIRLPAPEAHECGPYCGLPGSDGFAVRRMLLATRAAVGPWAEERSRGGGDSVVHHAARRRSSNCTLFWAGAVRGWMNPERRLLVRHMQQPGLCVRNTACSPPAATKSAKSRSDFVPDESCADGGEGTLGPAHRAPSLPVAMASARFCYSPRGWNGGDSDRYLAALLYGCVPLMSDRLEAMPLHEHPEVRWHASALAADVDALPRVASLLARVGARAEAALRASPRSFWQRMLYTSRDFGKDYVEPLQRSGGGGSLFSSSKRGGGGRGGGRGEGPCTHRRCCARCSPAAHAGCRLNERPRARATSAAVARFHAELGLRLRRLGIRALPNGSLLPGEAAEAGRAVCEAQRSHLGEDGRRDALISLVEILRERLQTPPAPLEPWHVPRHDDAPPQQHGGNGNGVVGPLHVFGDGTAVVSAAASDHMEPRPAPAACEASTGHTTHPALDEGWFRRRARWYRRHLSRGTDAGARVVALANGEQQDSEAAVPGELRFAPVIRVAVAHRCWLP